ncbi:MAG: hypothetical protein EHM24_32960, partial [Acidobacteria bacterium]
MGGRDSACPDPVRRLGCADGHRRGPGRRLRRRSARRRHHQPDEAHGVTTGIRHRRLRRKRDHGCGGSSRRDSDSRGARDRPRARLRPRRTGHRGTRPAGEAVMTIHLAACAYALPEASEDAASVLSRERVRVEAALGAVTPGLRRRVEANLGIARVRVCAAGEQPYYLARRAAIEALDKAGIPAGRVDLLIDYSTLPGSGTEYVPMTHRLATDLGLEASLNVNLKFSGCAAFHLAVKLAASLMRADDQLRVALLVAADTPPLGSRSLMPITVQGDAGSAVVLSSDDSVSPEIVSTAVLTLGG